MGNCISLKNLIEFIPRFIQSPFIFHSSRIWNFKCFNWNQLSKRCRWKYRDSCLFPCLKNTFINIWHCDIEKPRRQRLFFKYFFYLSFIISFSWIIIINNNRNNNIVAFRFSSYLRTTNNFYSVFSSIILFLHFFAAYFAITTFFACRCWFFFSFNLFTTNFFLQCFSTSLTIFCLFYFFSWFFTFTIYDPLAVIYYKTGFSLTSFRVSSSSSPLFFAFLHPSLIISFPLSPQQY